MMGQRRSRCPSIKTTLGQRIMFAGSIILNVAYDNRALVLKRGLHGVVIVGDPPDWLQGHMVQVYGNSTTEAIETNNISKT